MISESADKKAADKVKYYQRQVSVSIHKYYSLHLIKTYIHTQTHTNIYQQMSEYLQHEMNNSKAVIDRIVNGSRRPMDPAM